MSKGFRGFARRPAVVDDTVAVLIAMPCPEYQGLKTRFVSAEKQFEKYKDKKNRDMIGPYPGRSRNIQREAKANMKLFGERMLAHKACCLLCKNDPTRQPSS